MEKSLQTECLKMRVYNLTQMFTRSLQPIYCYQYTGDLHDLAVEFFTEFLTPKSTCGRLKESLLDKFNPEVTSLEYLIKVCVKRKLIDWSRQHPYKVVSLDKMLEELGDLYIFPFCEVEDESSIIEDERLLSKVISEFNNLPEILRNKLFVSIFDSSSKLRTKLQPIVHYVRECPIQQITQKTAVLYVPSACKLVGFSLEDGHPRGKLQPFLLTDLELTYLRSLQSYNSQFSRELFIEFCSYDKD